MAKIENPKNYTGRDLETIFFRPMLSGSDAVDLGIKILYNTPVPTTLQFWKRAGTSCKNTRRAAGTEEKAQPNFKSRSNCRK